MTAKNALSVSEAQTSGSNRVTKDDLICMWQKNWAQSSICIVRMSRSVEPRSPKRWAYYIDLLREIRTRDLREGRKYLSYQFQQVPKNTRDVPGPESRDHPWSNHSL